MHHCAIKIQDLDWNLSFFRDVFQMVEVNREVRGEATHVWLSGGLQLITTTQECMSDHSILDHIALESKDLDASLRAAEKYGVVSLEKGKNWIRLPYGLIIEIMA